MKFRFRKLVSIMLIAGLSTGTISAGRAFDVLHGHYRAELERGNIIRAINLYKPLSLRFEELEKAAKTAEKNKDADALAEIGRIIDSYAHYVVTDEEIRIIDQFRRTTPIEAEEKEAALFLFDNTSSYRPTITIKDELSHGSQVHVWIARPDELISFQHDIDESKLDGRMFLGYESKDGEFLPGEFPTFPMSLQSEVWKAVYRKGYMFQDPFYGYLSFSEADETGLIHVPQIAWLDSEYRISGWKDADTDELIAGNSEKTVAFDDHSRVLIPVWENIKLEQLHLGKGRKHMTHGSNDSYYLDIVNDSNKDMELIIEVSTTSHDVLADSAFELVKLKEGESCTVGPYDIEAICSKVATEVIFNVRIKALDSGNEWYSEETISIR